MNTEILEPLIQGRVEPYIYVFETKTIPNYLKVGDTYRPVSVRLDEWKKYFPDLYSPPSSSQKAKLEDNVYFRDFAVHSYLEKDLHKNRLERKKLYSKEIYYSKEFFENTTLEDVNAAINDIRDDYKNRTGKYEYYDANSKLPVHIAYAPQGSLIPRPNQQKAIDAFVKAVKNQRRNLLMYAVMRFGKSFTAMCCALKLKKIRQREKQFVVIVSAKADVCDEWRRTIECADNFRNIYEFIEPKELKNNYNLITDHLNNKENNKGIVLFLTLQDLQGSEIKEKHSQIFSQQVDLLIVDETHFGARAESYGKILQTTQFIGEKKHKYDFDDGLETKEADELLKGFDADTILHLSGTPYRILMGSEFQAEDIIAFCQYSDIVDEQKKWDAEHLDQSEEWENPYFGFPQMIRFAFNPNQSSIKRLEELKKQGVTYTLSALLKPQSIRKDDSGKHKEFVYETEVLGLLKAIDGTTDDENLFGFLDYPKIKEGNMCRHLVFVLPYCASCDAMEALLLNHAHEFKNLKDYKVINISGIDKPDSYKSPEAIKAAIEECEENDQKTITLTVNRMLTGSTVKEWDTMLFLKDTSSPQEYDQAIFRLQNQYVVDKCEIDKNGKRVEGKPPVKFNMKPQTLLVDFDPVRLFRMQENKAQIYNVNTDQAGNSKLEERIAKELMISPVITVNLKTHKMEEIQPVDIMNAVSEYSSNRGIMEEVSGLSVDMAMINNPTVWNVIQNENELGSKGGFKEKAAQGDGNELDTPDSQIPQGTSLQSDNNTHQDKNQDESDQTKSVIKKFQMYYARIMYYAFLSADKLLSVEDIVKSCGKGENKRIFNNLGLDKAVLEQFLKMDKFILRSLDYAIQHLNQLAHDQTKTPLEKAAVADKKFGRLGVSQIVTPDFVADSMIDLFSDAFLKECVKHKKPILDIASKKGEFAMALYRRFCKLNIPVEQFSDLIYSIPTSSISYEFTRNVYKMLALNVHNIAAGFTCYDLLTLKTDSGELDYDRIKNLLSPGEGFDKITVSDHLTERKLLKMKFEIIVGNPPYQLTLEDTSDKPVYHLFIDVACKISDRCSLITPARFLFNAGKTPKEWNSKILNDCHFKVVWYKSKSVEVFPNVDIKGGVSVFLYDKTRKFNAIGTFTAFEELNSILLKVKNSDFSPLSDYVYAPESYKLTQELHDDYPQIYKKLSTGHKYDVTSNIFEKLPEVFMDSKIDDGFVRVYGLINGERVFKWIKKRYLKATSNFDKYKIFIPKANGSGTLGEVLSTPIIGLPKIGHTQTFISIGQFASKTEASAALKYIKSKFARALLGTLKVTQDNKKASWGNVPLQDFTSESDIDWSKSIPEIDQQLYKKYGLTKEEIAFIESMIKPME